MRLAAAVRWLPQAAHLLTTLWLFEAVVFRGQLPFFRDVALYYYPNYVFLSRSLAQGIWPLWNPANDAGAAFLIAYPLELVLVLLLGPVRALALGPPLHVFLAMCGATLLARRLGQGRWGSWLAGAAYGLSGYLLSTLNLFELSHAAAWAPWTVWAMTGLFEAPGGRRAALVACLVALLVSTLSVETILQALAVPLLLMRRRPTPRAILWLAAAGALAAMLAAPAILGTRALVEGTQRARGFEREVAFAWSVHPAVLFDAALPRFFGDPHTFSQLGYWGQRFFPDGYPYLLSLYLGLPLLLLAARAGPGHGRLWALAALGVLLSLGSHGPLEPLLTPLMRYSRAPVKFFFLAALALALLAGAGLDTARRANLRGPLSALVPGALLLAAAGALGRWPDAVAAGLGGWAPALASWQSQHVARELWPEAFGVTGALTLGSGLAQRLGGRAASLAGALACLDLLIVNGPINVSAAASFYAATPELEALVASVRSGDGSRWFSYGAAASGGVRFAPDLLRTNRDLWLYYAERQSLLPRTQVLDGLEGAFDEDRVGWAQAGAALAAHERRPELFSAHRFRLRLASVRWVLSFRELPEDLAERRGEARIPGMLAPLLLYELDDALPRALWVPRAERSEATELERRVRNGGFDPRAVVLLDVDPPAVRAPPSESPASVAWQQVNAHEVRLRVNTPPGMLLVTNGYHRDWVATDPSGRLPLLRANGRYWAIPTDGGERSITVRYRPLWRLPATMAAAVGAVLCLALSRSSS